jgi:predicted phosphohydrolase
MPEFRDVIWATTIPEVEEDLKLRTLKGTKIVIMKPNR